MSEHILVVDDEREITDLIGVYLKNDGYEVTSCYDAAGALEAVGRETFDLAILDIMLPDMDGFDLCAKIREEHLFPIIFLTAKVADIDKIRGLSVGADDYVTKPFNAMELMARVRAVLRRRPAEARPDEYRLGSLSVSPERHEVRVDGEVTHLTYKEFMLLQLLFENRDRVLTREVLLDRIWGLGMERENRTLDVHIRTLRAKLGSAGSCIQTVRGVGYRLHGDEA